MYGSRWELERRCRRFGALGIPFLIQDLLTIEAARPWSFPGPARRRRTVCFPEFVKRNADACQEFLNQAVPRTLRPIDSHANFAMMNTHHSAHGITDHFRRNKVLIGREVPALNTYIRVLLGSPEEMPAFWSAWDNVPFPKGHH